MNHFRADLLGQIDVRTFYQAEGLKLSRPSRGWSRTSCPFHQGKSTSLSIHLATGGFYCFSCETKGGDLIDYVKLRDGCDFRTACMVLNCWDAEPSPETQRELERQRKERERLKVVAEDLRQQQHALLIETRDSLHLNHCLYRQTSEYLTELGIDSTSAEADSAWHVLSLLLPEVREDTATYDLMTFSGAEVQARYTLNEPARAGMITTAINDSFVHDEDGHIWEIDFS